MDAGLFVWMGNYVSAAELQWLFQNTFSLNEPSTLQMALIGFGTIGVYTLGKRYFPSEHSAGQPAGRISPPFHAKTREAA